LQLKALEFARDRSAVEKALENLPGDLDETYNRALLNINSRQERHAINALKWLTFSVRPLLVDELAEASIIDPKSFSLTEDSKLFSPKDVLAFLPGLVIVTEEYNWAKQTTIHRIRTPCPFFGDGVPTVRSHSRRSCRQIFNQWS
jgi:hypothetical protein